MIDFQDPFIKSELEKELSFSTSRSSGPGGQNVNKVSSKVELRFAIRNSAVLTQEEKDSIHHFLKNRISTDGILILSSQTSPSQLSNKKYVTSLFYKLLTSALKKKTARIKTSPTKASQLKNLQRKKANSHKKYLRGKNFEQE